MSPRYTATGCKWFTRIQRARSQQRLACEGWTFGIRKSGQNSECIAPCIFHCPQFPLTVGTRASYRYHVHAELTGVRRFRILTSPAVERPLGRDNRPTKETNAACYSRFLKLRKTQWFLKPFSSGGHTTSLLLSFPKISEPHSLHADTHFSPGILLRLTPMNMDAGRNLTQAVTYNKCRTMYYRLRALESTSQASS